MLLPPLETCMSQLPLSEYLNCTWLDLTASNHYTNPLPRSTASFPQMLIFPSLIASSASQNILLSRHSLSHFLPTPTSSLAPHHP